MGWKNVKEYYRIDHQVEITDEGLCIGSAYVHAIIVISLDGAIVKEDDRTLNEKLMRYQAEMKADPAKLRDLITSPDSFTASIPVYTYRGAEIIEKCCAQLGWPNVTHDGQMMYENTFFAQKEEALDAARRNCEASIMLRRMEISDQHKRMAKSTARLEELLDNAKTLGLSVPVDAAYGDPRRTALEEAAGTHDARVIELRNDPTSYKNGKITRSAKRASDFHERSAAAIRLLHSGAQ